MPQRSKSARKRIRARKKAKTHTNININTNTNTENIKCKMFENIEKQPQKTLKEKFKVDLKPVKFKSRGYKWNVNYYSPHNKKIISPYKDKHLEKKCVILATGNTLDDYIPIKGAIHMGVNSIVYYKKIIADYYFAMDNPRDMKNPTHFRKNKKQVYKYKPKIQKFFGKVRKGTKMGNIPIIDEDTKRFEIMALTPNFVCPTKDVGNYCFGLVRSTIFIPLQFALYCGIKTIYLVGCDCEGSNFKFNEKQQLHNTSLLNHWKITKKWIEIEYPNVKIKVINPRGLKDIFPEHEQ